MKTLFKKRFTKKDRQQAVLSGLVRLFIDTNKPIGSNSLKESGLDFLSSATIRNYFSKLEEEGFLLQSHASGGRVPTDLAYRFYANEALESYCLSDKEKKKITEALKLENKEVSNYLNKAAEILSEMTGLSVFVTSPRFDQDFIKDVKLFRIDDKKLLCVLITDFGMIRAETIFIPKKIENEKIEEIQNYFLWKLGKISNKPALDEPILKLAQHFYNETLMRHIVGYANFFTDEVYKTGLSKLLRFPEFADPVILAKNLSLFEEKSTMLSLLSECMKINRLTCWIGDELKSSFQEGCDCTIIAIPYRINRMVVGAISILGPMRVDYPKLFAILELFSETISHELTSAIYKYKLSYRTPMSTGNYLAKAPSILLEDKSKS